MLINKGIKVNLEYMNNFRLLLPENYSQIRCNSFLKGVGS